MKRTYVVTHHMGTDAGIVTLCSDEDMHVHLSVFNDRDEVQAQIEALKPTERHTIHIMGIEYLTFQPLSE